MEDKRKKQNYLNKMARGLRLSVCLIVVHMSFVAGSEFCYSGGFYHRYCDGDKYCCNYDTECCSPLETGAIIGIVIGCLAFVACVVGAVICACQKKGHQGAVVNAYPPNAYGSTTGVITVATAQNPYLGQQYGPPPPAYHNQQFAPPYQNPGMTWQPPNQIPQNHPDPPVFQPGNPAYPPQ